MATVGFFTDVTLCIGCKACEVACKQWNQLPDDGYKLTGMSYDNTVALGASTWRHVLFNEKPQAGGVAWKMMSDVCKHCERAGCLEACPTGAIIRTEHVTPRRGAERYRVVERHAGQREAVVGQLVPLLARDLAGLATDAQRRVREKSDVHFGSGVGCPMPGRS